MVCGPCCQIRGLHRWRGFILEALNFKIKEPETQHTLRKNLNQMAFGYGPMTENKICGLWTVDLKTKP
jgi:hypothetical protein